MAKFQSPLLGYNNNVRHRGRVFHVQTEDSGVNHPHVITHLFMDGGRILKSVKKSYAEHVGSDTLKDTVRVLMKEQHKAMFISLRAGEFDVLVDGPKKGSDPTQKSIVAPPASTPEAVAAAAEPPPPPVSTIELAPPATEPEPPVAPPPISAVLPEDAPPNTIDESRRPEPFALEANGPNTIRERVAASAATPTNGDIRRPSAAELTLDFDALERDSGSGVSPMFQTNDLPPPPKNLFAKERGTGAYRTIEATDNTHHDHTRAPARPSTPPRTATKPPPSVRTSNENGRYAAARPASIFGTSTLKPAAAHPPPPSIFGDELVSDKSLDEVILSYLAEDLDPRK